jgi:hypothetical protein
VNPVGQIDGIFPDVNRRAWQLFCSSAGVTGSPTIKCAKKEQSMESQSRARISPDLGAFSAFPPVPIADKELHRGRGVADGLKQLGDENNRRRVSQIEATIADFDKTANDLESWIQAEQNRTRIHDPTNPVYSTLARAMTQRRDKLKRSIDVLKRQLADIAPTAA